jgi:hypothetical protein
VSRPVVALLFVCCVAAALPTGALAVAPDRSVTPASTGTASSVVPSVSSAPSADAPSLVGVHPNPASDGDVGEFVVLDVPASANLTALRVCDDEGCLAPDREATGRVAVTRAPERVRPLVGTPVVGAEGDLSMANGGEPLALRRGDRTLGTVRYGDAPEAETYRLGGDGADARWTWTPLGASDHAVATTGPANATAFVLPDAPGVVTRTLAGADERLLLAGYTLTSSRVAEELLAAHRRGVDVRVLVEGGPVGGLPRAEARVLDRLVDAGVTVRVVDGPYARYEFHHEKYAVVDGRALVLTENWKPAGSGGNASRGWGAVVDDRRLADRLADVFRGDAAWRGARNWSAFRTGRSFVDDPPATGSFPTGTAPESVRVERVRLLVAPDNAESGVRALLADATDSVDVVQVGLGGPDGPFVRELLAAARRGVGVRVLLSGSWYVREENRALADRLNARADREDLPLTVRLAEPNGAFEKIHAKGAVVDGEHVLLGSLNWNAHAARENREVALVLSGEAVAGYYGDVFAADWRGDGSRGERVPVGALAALVAAVLLALAVARRFEFER